ncbi:hypothetical protein HU200_001242 [Digitaria exilis]|uniref:Uncharacterized protein n=1 Tax=Digitaria exilis TaxID=1010633 RepID=A0A835KUX1_9POAL|nr:hypothetical protein HU200_001242 [Digitaria exilis]
MIRKAHARPDVVGSNPTHAHTHLRAFPDELPEARHRGYPLADVVGGDPYASTTPRNDATELDEEEAEVAEPLRTPPRIDDYLIAEEILPRLPVRTAAAFAVAGTTLRCILTDVDYWLLRNHRLPPPPPQAACFVPSHHDGHALLENAFHFADATPSSSSRAVRGGGSPSMTTYRLAGTCNGLVLLTAPSCTDGTARGVLFNPASGEEETVVVNLSGDGGGGGGVCRTFCGFGYDPSSKTYKPVVCAVDIGAKRRELLMAPFSASAASRREPRTPPTTTMSYRFENPRSLSLDDGKVYVLDEDTLSSTVLILDVADETVTAAAAIPNHSGGGEGTATRSELMEVWGLPCIASLATREGMIWTTLWALTPEHRPERRCRVVVVPYGGYPYAPVAMRGAWDCGDGHLFMLFGDGHGCKYDLGKECDDVQWILRPRQPEEGEEQAAMAELLRGTFCWGYRPTLVRLASVFGDGGEGSGEGVGLSHFSAGGRRRSRKSGRRRCLETLVEMMTRTPHEDMEYT